MRTNNKNESSSIKNYLINELKDVKLTAKDIEELKNILENLDLKHKKEA